MAFDLTELKRLHEKAYVTGQGPREEAANDLIFSTLSHWDDQLLEESQLSYRGQFDITRKAVRQIMSDLRENPVQVNFEPVDESRDDGADLIDGLYRADDRDNQSIEAFDNAIEEAVVCGMGAWELYTDYASSMSEDQVIKRTPLFEANNTVYFDPNAKLADKSDANHVSILKPYSEDGYKDLVEELTGERPDTIGGDFGFPEQSFTFPWFTTDKKIYVATFYHRKKVKKKILTLSDPFGGQMTVSDEDIKPVIDELIDAGYEVSGQRNIKKWQVTRYIASGEEILKTEKIAGEHIPVVPVYGERSVIDGVEYYEGVVRLAKDPQRLHNFALSYMADIVSRSPRSKPIFYPEQIAGFEQMYEQSGAKNNYPYMLNNRFDPNGNELPLGAVAVMPEQPIPQSLTQLLELTRRSVEDVASAGLPDNVSDIDLSGKAIQSLQNRFDQQSIIYQTNLKHAKRRDGQVYASLASEVFDTPRTVTIVKPDGTSSKQKIMEQVIDSETGQPHYVRDLTNAEFAVYSDIGPTYSNRKEQTREQLTELLAALPPDDPLRQSVMLKILEMSDGIDMKDFREYSRKQLILSGFKEPETPEDEQLLQQAQQAQQEPDANMVLAQAEAAKGQADQMDAQTKQFQAQISQFDAETKRMQVMAEAQEKGIRIQHEDAKNKIAGVKALADIRQGQQKLSIDTFKAKADATAKLRASVRGRANA